MRFNIKQDQSVNRIKRVLFINPSMQKEITVKESNDLYSLKNSLFIGGLNYTETSVEKIDSLNMNDFDVIVLPYASSKRLNDREVFILAEAVNNGSSILLDGVTKMSGAVHINMLNKPISVSNIIDLQFPKDTLYWTDTVDVMPVEIESSDFKALCIDMHTKKPIAVNGTYGKGKIIYFSPLFDPITDKGYSRFPFLIESLDKIFGLRALAERKSVEMYFDPGMRDGFITIKNLVKLWRQRNIKRIYAAGWYFDYGYDYETLINTCHANGILVYCWLETPMISKGFWDRHPEWREKTATLRDAYVDWRYLMNLADDSCRKEVFAVTEKMITSYDWDGVNLAELYFEPSPVGPELPENFTPMNNLVRKEFKDISGFDPILIFDTLSSHYWRTNNKDWKQFAQYRKDLCYRLKQNFLDFLIKVQNKKKDLEVMLTVIDVSLTPEISDNIGEDTKHTLSLYSKYNISMQIEDPSSCWGLTPERYDKLGKLYRKYIKEPNRLVFDCNVVNAHELGFGGFPAEKPSGEEIRQIAYNMSLSKSRPAFYSEDAVNENDFHNISTVLSHETKIKAESDNKWGISTPYTTFVNIGNSEVAVKLDDKMWLGREKEFIIIPIGNHTLEFCNETNLQSSVMLKSISGELNWANFGKDSLELSYYEELNSCFVIISKNPQKISIDAKYEDCEIYNNDSTEYTVKLPRGKHNVKMNF